MSEEQVSATTAPPESGHVVQAGEGLAERPGRMVMLQTAHTGGTLSMGHSIIKPGILVPPHTHTQEDETWYVIAGAVMLLLGDDIFRLEAGGAAWRPRGHAHASWVAPGDEPAEVVGHVIPGGWETRILEFDRTWVNGEFDESAFVAMASDNGVYWDFDRGRRMADELGLVLMGSGKTP